MNDQHDDSLKYAKDVYVDFCDDAVDSWMFGQTADGLYEAQGPCPICRGTAYGPRLVDLGGPATKSMPGQDVDVVCACHCDFDHGGGSSAGCGRWWVASFKVSA